MSTLDNIQTSFSRLTDIAGAQETWRMLVSLDPRVTSALATYSRPALKSISARLHGYSTSVREAAARYYSSGPRSVTGGDELSAELAALRAKLEAIYTFDDTRVETGYTDARVSYSMLRCPLINDDYTIDVNGALYSLPSRPASLPAPVTTSINVPVRGEYLQVVGSETVKRAFSTDSLPEGWVDDGSIITAPDDVACIIPIRHAGTRARGITRAAALSGVFMSASEIRAATGGELTTTTSSEVVDIAAGAVSSLDEFSVVMIGRNSYVVVDGRLVEFDTDVPASDLNGVYPCSVSQTHLVFKGTVACSDPSAVTHVYRDAELKTGDIGDSDNGEPSTRVALVSAMRALTIPDLPSVLHVRDPQSAAAAGDIASAADEAQEGVARAIALLAPPRQRVLLDELLSRMERVGLDRAADTLREGDVATFMSMTATDASYSAVLRDMGAQLKVQVQL